jgi:stress response protein YsnF
MTEPYSSGGDSPDEKRRDGMTLSEEELVINTELVESGRARLIKRVEVETVTRTIELRREVLEIERLDPTPQPGATAPPDAGAAGSASGVLETGPLAPGSLREGTVEIVLMQEEALVTTQMVPRECVRLTKHVIAEGQPIEANLRTERVDLEQRPSPRDGKAPD